MGCDNRLYLVLKPVNFALTKVKLIKDFEHNLINKLWLPARNWSIKVGN